jgi:hypothetical protein
MRYKNIILSCALIIMLSAVSVAQKNIKNGRLGEFQLNVGDVGKFSGKINSKTGTKEIHITGNPITLSSPQMDLQGKDLVAYASAVKGETFIKSATVTEKVRIVLRQEGEKHIITCNKAQLESESIKGKKIVHLYGNIRDESVGVFGDAVMLAETGRIEWDGPMMEINLDNPNIVGNIAPKPTPKPTPKPKSPVNPPKKDNK